MKSNLFEWIRSAAASVVALANYVHINEKSIAEYAASLPIKQVFSLQFDPFYHYIGEPIDTVAYILTLDTINFGSGYFPYIRKSFNSGYFTIAFSLKKRFEKEGAFTAAELSQLTKEDCANIFEQNLEQAEQAELMELFALALNELGQYLINKFAGEFVNLVEAAEFEAERFVQILAQMSYFQDIQQYKGITVPFYKRSQIAVTDLALAFNNQSFGFFKDLDNLTIFADNLVPHVLKVDGILDYDDALASRINKQDLILSGSIEEIEIRASAIHAVELIVAELRKTGHNVTARQLDYLLWNRGQQPKYKALPRHITRTVFY